jgi:phage tail sheath protein FI
LSNDPEWKYVSVRRYFNFVIASIERGLKWTVFEPNGDTLWARVRDTIANFLMNEWQTGALQGRKPEEAFFAHCDRTTMTQDDIDNGRLICVIGMAPVKPAEFVIVRIGLWTSDHKP